MHMPQSVTAETELKNLAAVPYQLVSPSTNSPLTGIYQDSLLGSFRFTRPNIKFTPREAMNLLMSFNSVNTDSFKNKKEITNFDILSQVLPPITLKYKTKLYDEDEDFGTSNNVLEIRNGVYIRGQIEKSVLGSTTKGIIHRIANDYGNMKAIDFIDDTQNIITEYMKSSSFSVGISDLIANKKTQDAIIQAIAKQKHEVQTIIEKVHLGIFENNTASSNMDEFESCVNKQLNKANEEAGKIGRKSLNKDNRFLMIVNSGSKGTLINISQMISCLGQTNVDGKRIPYGFDSRTLPHFNKFDDSPIARGFIENSYISGLTAPELFFHAMGGRIGLIDTACKSVTWETPIVFIENNEPKYMEIGRWIDNKLENNKEKIKHYTDRQMELLDVDGIYIPTTDENGVVSWGEVTAMTRHDPGNQLYEITTKYGRTVTVVESQSLLIWDEEKQKVLPKNSQYVKIGDCVPVTFDLCGSEITLPDSTFDIEQVIDEILYDVFDAKLLLATNVFITKLLLRLFERSKDYESNIIKMEFENLETLHGVTMLCSRVSMPVKISGLTLTVLDISELRIHNNVMLDSITKINIIGIESHPKVYDLTIPSTLNFGLANGLQVRDTSSTGYIQRRLIKGLEDLRVEYDMTVRNNMGKIVQFAYGDDGFDSTKVENQVIPLVGMSVEDIYMHYDIVGVNDQLNDLLNIYTKGAQTRVNKQRIEAKAKCREYIDLMIKNQDSIVKQVFQHKNENSIKIPVAFQNIIANIQGQMSLNSNSVVDITPLEAFNLIEEYYKKLNNIHYVKPNLLFKILYYFYLNPKDLLINKRFHKVALTLLLETIVLKYKQAIVHPGEMVGVVAGQSLGEPTTQLSVLRSEKMKIIRVNKTTNVAEMISGEIGTICDNIIETLPEYTFETGHKDSVETLLEPLDDEYYIVGVDEKEKTHWNKISHVSRHIVNGDMIRVKTKSGRVVETTMSHSHLIRKDQTVQPILGSEMELGMRIPVAKHIDNLFVRDSVVIAGETYKLDHLFGWFIGAYLAEGCLVKKKGKMEATGTISISNISEHYIENTKKFAARFNRTCTTKTKTAQILNSEKCYTNTDTIFTYKPLADLIMNTCGTGSFVKCVPDFAFLAPNEFKAGLLSGYMDGDGNFMCDKLHHCIRVCSRSKQLMKDISLLFNYFDIFGSLHQNYRNGDNYYHLAISPKYAKKYQSDIGSNLHTEKLQKLVDYNDRADVHSLREDIDKINGLGNIIANCGKLLEIPGQSRYYGRWKKKDSIGRSTLQKYVELFETHEKAEFIKDELSILRQAANSSVIWDEIVEIERYTPEQTEYVYDFTVPGNQTFMTDYGVIVHNTLNTFHLSGVASKSNVTRGVPRIEEILRLTKNPKNPSLTVYLKPLDEQDKDKAVKYSKMLEHTKLVDVVKSVQICFDPNDNNTLILDDKQLLEQYFEFEKMMEDCADTLPYDAQVQRSKWIIRMEMDAEAMLDKNITMDDIHFAIGNSHGTDISCIYSDYNSSNLVFRLRLSVNIFNKKKVKGTPEALDQSDEIFMLRNFQETLLNNIVLRGVEGIRNVAPRKLQNNVIKEDGKYMQKDIWILDTTGTNLMEIMALEFIDGNRTFSNDIKEIFDVLGIEAARQIIYSEFVDVMEFSDVYINYHHLSLLCDRMTSTKDMVSIFRSGILNDDIGPISKATFEVHTEVLLDAARYGDIDYVRGVSANVMLGQHSLIGTNSFQVVLDMEKMHNVDSLETNVKDKNKEMEKLFSGLQDPSDLCSKNRVEIENNLTSIKQEEIGKCNDDGYDMGF